MKRIFLLLYNFYAWPVFGLFLCLACLGLLLPKLEQRRRVAGWAMRNALGFMGIKVRFHGAEQLPNGQVIAVANHRSFIDGPLINALLPPRFSFVVKREIADLALPGWILKRIDALLVDRFDPRNSARDGGSVIRQAIAGHSIVLFPEGGYSHPERLRPFKAGAFVAARKAQCPILPIAIQGSDGILPGDKWLLRPGCISVRIGAPIAYRNGEKSSDAVIRDEAITQIEQLLLAGTSAD